MDGLFSASLAKKTNSFTKESQTGTSQTGKITDITRAEVENHERFHVRIRTDLAKQFNTYVTSKEQEVKTKRTKQYSTKEKAEKAAKLMANLFYAQLMAEYIPATTGMDTQLDSGEAGGVDTTGVWRLEANSTKRTAISNAISNYTVSSVNTPNDNEDSDCK